MKKITFKCKGKSLTGDLCDRYVSTKIHKGISSFLRIQELTKEINNLERINGDFDVQKNELIKLQEIPLVPKYFEFTLKCSNNHEYEYSYDEREQ